MREEIIVTRMPGPWSAGLAGFIDNKLAIVVAVKPKNRVRWAMGRVTKRDRERVNEALVKQDKQQ